MHHRNAYNIPFLLLLSCIGQCLSETASNRPSTTFPYYQRHTDKPLPYNLRGGSTVTRTKKRQRKQRPAAPEFIHNIQLVTVQIHRNTSVQLQVIQSHAQKEWEHFLTNLPRLQLKRKSSNKLDEVCKSFSSVLSSSRIDTASLLKACRSHLTLMKSAGSSLRLVAKDLESNLSKVEKLYKSNTDKCRHLSSLLELERGMNIHNGNVLKDPSAAIGLLWIRRSLAFQADLYASLMLRQLHPREAAMSAYAKHLKPYHGWALGKIFTASLSQMPAREAFIAKFGGVSVDELDDQVDMEVVKKLKVLTEAWDPLLNCWKDEFERLDMEDVRRV